MMKMGKKREKIEKKSRKNGKKGKKGEKKRENEGKRDKKSKESRNFLKDPSDEQIFGELICMISAFSITMNHLHKNKTILFMYRTFKLRKMRHFVAILVSNTCYYNSCKLP